MDDLSNVNVALSNVNDKLPSGAVSSFRVDTTGASSLIDHIFVSSSFELVTSVDVDDSGINLSDRCAVVMELNLPSENQWSHKLQSQPKLRCYRWRWDKADLWSY